MTLRCSVAAVLSLSLALTAAASLAAPAGSASTEEALVWPGDARGDLAIPDAVWGAAAESLGFANPRVGYTRDEMALFGRDAHRLRVVENAFRDVRAMLRFSGERAVSLRDAIEAPATVAQVAYLLTDVSAGRMLAMPDSASWGVAWLPDGRSGAEAFDAIASFGGGAPGAAGVEASRASWRALPAPVQRLATRLFVGAADASPWLRSSFDPACLVEGTSGVPLDSLYARAIAPWNEERMGQSATLHRASLDALDRIDREYLAFGTVLFLTHVERALREFATVLRAQPGLRDGIRGVSFPTALGMIRILGSGGDSLAEGAFLTIDCGGDDRYAGRQGVPFGRDHPISLVVDLGGSDRYEEKDLPAAMACGLFGVGAIIDLEGDDVYTVRESGLGAGWYGSGVLYDRDGNDTYTVIGRWGQGAAHAGVGILIDRAGSDVYTCASESQAMGSTLGAGLLIDGAGNDRYIARDDGNVSELYLNQSVAMAQGVGYGRRADLGDGHSLAGGVGMLLDCAGDDLYHSQVWSQGAGYWWAIGILEDLGGNDRYENGKYSLGAGAHFAIGCQVDLAGNDAYNPGNATAVNQYQGHARDGSIGISVDGDGDDTYFFKTHCGGSGDLASIGIFWDRRGDDRYEVDAKMIVEQAGWGDTPPMGSATVYPPSRTFRDDLKACGIFLDTGGHDLYAWENGTARDDHAWRMVRGPVSFGFGRDANLYRR